MIGTTLKMYNSPDGLLWTEQFSVIDTEYASGDMQMSLFNGVLIKNVGPLKFSNCAFQSFKVRNL